MNNSFEVILSLSKKIKTTSCTEDDCILLLYISFLDKYIVRLSQVLVHGIVEKVVQLDLVTNISTHKVLQLSDPINNNKKSLLTTDKPMKIYTTIVNYDKLSTILLQIYNISS